MSSATSLSSCWAGVCKLPAKVDGASLLTTDVGVGVPPELETGVRVAKIVAAIDCVGPTTVVGVVSVPERCSGLTLSKYFLFLVCVMPLPL